MVAAPDFTAEIQHGHGIWFPGLVLV
jgi:hypothetical protein